MGEAKLMNSFWAVRRIRYYQMFTIPGSIPHTTTLITFITPTCAKEYLSYVSEHGFFLSERLPPGYVISDTQDECIYISPYSQFQCLFRRAPHVILKPWLGPGKTDGKLITGNEGGYCNVSREIEKEGATRSLRITPETEPKELQRTLSYLATELKVESCRLTALAPTKELATTICFCSVHDAVIVKTYLTSQKAFSGPDGRIVSYVKSPTDKPIENLGWHKVSKPKPIETLPVGRSVTLGVPKANGNTHKSLTKNDLCSFLAVGELEINTHPSDEIDRDSESYRDEMITPKEAEPKRDVYLTEIHQSSRDPIVAVNIVNSEPSMLVTGSFHPGPFPLDEIAQTQDVPGVATQAEVLVYQSLSPRKAEIEIVDRLELDPPKNALKLLNTNQVRSEPNSREGSIKNFLNTLPLLNKELLES
ncbi:hypothetical protein P167DRAFT_548998 [Morchella conica CCBAS932]|uniref:Uncharacterized protein n=1 Tax=Morchella conica CCBAS932 TaxID=1392247 RepID=A0A3N4KGB7_9PEZI|nr:hypothetical protein P167DRAFT_548998 [Morchella conica CCBAS932]